MIELSAQAPAPQSLGGADGVQGVATGASGFLRLFEILLGGMPQGGMGAEGGPFAQDALAEGANPALPLGIAMPATAPGLASGAVGGDDALLDLVDPSAMVMPMADAVAIADLLRGIGFPIEPAEIASLGPLDLQQLASAMEFLQRGVQAGMAGDDLLENASCLMPREWHFHGGDDVATPRSEALASGAESSSGIDAAQILACAEAVRGILVPQQPSAVPARVGSSAPAIANASGVSSVVATDSDIQGLAADPPTAKGFPADLRAAKEVVIERPVDGASSVGTEARALPAVSRRTSSSRRDASEMAAAADAPVSRPERADVPAAQQRVGARIGGEAKRQGFEIGAAVVAGATAETAPIQVWGAKPLQDSRDVASPIATQGVKAGSMASEFIGRQVLEKVDVQLKQGRRELNVRLWPEELGEVRLSLRIGEADKLDARIMVQTESVRQAILDATPQLREALARHGMEMGRLSVNIDAGMASGEGASQGDGRKDRPDGGHSRWRGDWQDEEVEYGTALALGVDSGYRDGRNTLDMWS